MKATEKAKELVDRFNNVALLKSAEGLDKENLTLKKASIQLYDKQCAFICVDEMIDMIMHSAYHTKAEEDYWEEIKQEIEKL